jgi:hypothetical protein
VAILEYIEIGYRVHPHTHIILADVNAFGANSESNVYAIIDEEWQIMLLGDLMELLCCPY